MLPSRITLVIVLTLLCAVANANIPGTLPAPPSIYRFVSTVQTARSLSVKVSETEQKPGQKPVLTSVCSLSVEYPGRLRMVSRVLGQLDSVLVSDGKTVRQWDDGSVYTCPAPANVADIDTPMDINGTAANLALDALTTPDQFGELPEYTDLGPVHLNSISAEKLTATNAHGTKTLWLDSRTHLPLLYTHSDPKMTYTVVFSDYERNQKIDDTIFSQKPSTHLATFVAPPPTKMLAGGTPAPDFDLPTLDGSTLSLSSLRGSVILIDFWASWCGPCKMSMPDVEALYRDLGPKGLRVLSVNTWDKEPFMRSFLKKHPQYNTTFLYDGNSPDKSVAYNLYKVDGIPTLYLIDQSGNVVNWYQDEPIDTKKLRGDIAKLGIQ